MKLNVYKLECITNLHVGSGDFNYGVIDNEVERDCLSGNPVIHASGIKGALRDVAEQKAGTDKEKQQEVIRIFGGKGDNKNDTNKGAYKFFDAQLLSRPLRVSGNEEISYISVTTPEIINNFIDTLSSFGFKKLPAKLNVKFGDTRFFSNKPGVLIESDEDEFKSAEISADAKATLDAILGKGYYALAESLSDYKLPVIARNKLGENKNLWYEEYVPHGSVFYMMIMSDNSVALDFSAPVQFGGNASIGYGYTKVTEFEVK